DPSNRDPSFARVRLRRLLPRLAAAGLPPERFAETARVLGRARATRERALARLLVRVLALDPLGYGWLDPEVLRAAPADLSRRALARCLVTIGGLAYAPRRARLERLHRRILAESGSVSPAGLGRGATLGGCRILPRGGRLLVVREAGRAEALDFGQVRERLWDGRFRLSLARPAGDTGLELGPLGTAGRAALRAEGVEIAPGGLPAPACAALPALRDAKGLVAVPNLGYRRPGTGIPRVAACRFAPRNPLCGGAFTVA
ncbi:MAG TPA: hypothetical protein VLL72_00325, partial [Kiloniellales bacterium]|nr:hypothetical protein [Kiloniellales bacterium]